MPCICLDWLPNLVELHFADDIPLFANSGPEAAQLSDKLIVAVGRAGLILNAEKSVVLTNQAQPPATLVIRDDVVVTVPDRNPGQEWLGCMLIMLTPAGSKKQGVDLLYDIQQGTKCFHSNRWILQNRKSSVLSRLKYFILHSRRNCAWKKIVPNKSLMLFIFTNFDPFTAQFFCSNSD